MNRLKLDFSLPTAKERKEFLDKYLDQPFFRKTPLTKEELETCANYLLWGKDEDGKNAVQRKEIQIKTKYRTWDAQEVESLDALMEAPTFNENLVTEIGKAIYKKPKETFSREDALRAAKDNPQILESFRDLFEEIDKVDYIINMYELKIGKRKKPPRAELIERLSEEIRNYLQLKAESLSQYQYLKLRHELVELRTRQYTLRDCVQPTMLFDTLRPSEVLPLFPTLDVEIPVFPLGLKNKEFISKLIFRQEDDLNLALSEEELKIISDFIWEKNKVEEQRKNSQRFFFDFRDVEHVYQLFNLYEEFYDEVDDEIENTGATMGELLDTLKFYIEMAELTDIQRDVVAMKIKKKKNLEIAELINEKYNKSYTDNYISTIFRQKAIPQINEAAQYHLTYIQNIFWEENFKTCRTCGHTYLRDAHNFVRNARAKDGFTNRCKKCDRAKREENKRYDEERRNQQNGAKNI